MSAHVQVEPANYHFRFAQECFVSIVFGTAGQEFDDDVTIPVSIVLLIGHLAEEISQEDVVLAGFHMCKPRNRCRNTANYLPRDPVNGRAVIGRDSWCKRQ